MSQRIWWVFITQDKNLDFGMAEMNSLKNKTLKAQVGQLPAISYISRGYVVPYIHEISRKPLESWLKKMALRNNIFEVHDVDDLRKKLCKTRLRSSIWRQVCHL